MPNYIHIDKITKKIDFDIKKKPVGSMQWDFLKRIPGAVGSLKRSMEQSIDTVFVYLSLSCQENCPVCGIASRKLADKEYNTGGFIDFLHFFKKIGTNYIIFDGNSIDHKDFWQILTISCKLEFQVSVNVERRISLSELRKMRQQGVQKIQMKMHGLENEHAKYRNNYSGIIKNLELFKREDVYSSLIFSISENNRQNIKRYIEFCEKYGVGQFSFMRLPSCPFYTVKDWPFLESKSFLGLSKEIIKHRKTSKTHITSNEAIWKGCGAAAVSCCIMPGNIAAPCAYIDEYRKVKNAAELRKVWKSELFSNIRRSKRLKGKCGRCDYKFLCKGCRAVAMLTKKDIYAADPGCWLPDKHKNEN
ncbi:MAG: radical SAM protein [Minisyncoccales bacterium]|jgi:radical SAM protein with 4Fe4S-binding SPASM domain